jgi:hypothetical protein
VSESRLRESLKSKKVTRRKKVFEKILRIFSINQTTKIRSKMDLKCYQKGNELFFLYFRLRKRPQQCSLEVLVADDIVAEFDFCHVKN